jgi:ABC-type siderophore export system fused ATPase/permease subunit
LWRALRQDGLVTLGVLGIALFIAALGVLIEAILLQGVMRLGTNLIEPGFRWVAIVILFTLVLLLFAIELPITTIEQRIGRRLETRLRIMLLEKIPRLSDRYFHSRLTSDMVCVRCGPCRCWRSMSCVRRFN